MSGAAPQRIASGTGGEPLSAPTRGFMESRFGADFSDVRVHRGGEAERFNDNLNARAFTYGSHIWFGAGETPDNRALLAHELTHTLQQRDAPAIQRAPRVAGVDWTVDHSDVTTGTDKDLLIDAIAGYTGESASVAGAYVGAMVPRPTFAKKAPLYVHALDFLRDNRARFNVVDPWGVVGRAIDYCDISSASVGSLSDFFYSYLLVAAVYRPAAGTASFKHSSGTVYNVPDRLAGETEFAPSMRDSLLRPTAKPGGVTGGFPSGTNLLVSYGAQPGAVSASAAAAMIKKAGTRVPTKLKPFLEKLATDGTINVVLDRFLNTDGGSFKIEPVGLGGAHYSNTKPPSIEFDSDLFPGSGADREDTEFGVRLTLAHELYHYALDRVDAALTEEAGVEDHDLIDLMEDRFRIVEMIRTGVSPVSDDIDLLNGYVGSDHKPTLNTYIAANNTSGLASYVKRQDFLESMVYTTLVSTVSTNAAYLGPKGDIKHFLFDPAQVNDMAYLAAVNGVLLRKAFETAAAVAKRTGTPLVSVWSHADYQAEMNTFLSKYIALAASNRTAGAAALAGVI